MIIILIKIVLKKIIFDSISEFQEKTKLIDITTSQNQDKIKELFIRDDSK